MLRIGQLNKFNFKNKESAWCCERGLNSLNVVLVKFKYLHISYILLNFYLKLDDFNFML